MPNLERLIGQGVRGNLRSLSPMVSPMLWTSIATGKRPHKHGILGFTELSEDGKSVRPVTSLRRKSRAIWNILTLNALRSIVVGWWPSFPAEPINGVMVSNTFSVPAVSGAETEYIPKNAIHPAKLTKPLSELRVRQDEIVASDLRFFLQNTQLLDQSDTKRLSALSKLVAECSTVQSIFTELIQDEEWNFAAVYFDGIDHFSHGFMKYHPPKIEAVPEREFSIFRNVISRAYMFHDAMLGNLISLAGPQANVMVISDHGFHPDHLRPSQRPLEPAGPTSEHRDQGIFVASGPKFRAGSSVFGASILDVTPTILQLHGIGKSDDMDGRVLSEILCEKPIAGPSSWDSQPGYAGQHDDTVKVAVPTQETAMERLVQLGYIEGGSQSVALVEATREQNYNLALALMDADQYWEAAGKLYKLFTEHPVEVRFGSQLFRCLQALGRVQEMGELLAQMEHILQVAQKGASEQISEIEADFEASANDAALPLNLRGKAQLTASQRKVVTHLRSIAKSRRYPIDTLNAEYLAAAGSPEHAVSMLSKYIPKYADSPNFQIRIGNLNIQARRFEAALTAFTCAVELDDHNALGHLGLARSALKLRKHCIAKDAAMSAVTLAPNYAPARFFLGVALGRLGEMDEAISCLRIASLLNPNFPEANMMLSNYLRINLGDQSEITAHWRAARDIVLLKRKRLDEQIPFEFPNHSNRRIIEQLPKLERSTVGYLTSISSPNLIKSATLENSEDFITIVSGHPRSGTSTCMKMLMSYGIPAMTDRQRKADFFNPHGYWEYEPVKTLAHQNTWLGQAKGHALKVVIPLLWHLPQGLPYRVIMMRRPTQEITRSQKRMAGSVNKDEAQQNVADYIHLLDTTVTESLEMLDEHEIPYLELWLSEVSNDPIAADRRIKKFLRHF